MKSRRAQAHAKRRRVCNRCGKACHGNAYFIHRAACRKKIIHLLQEHPTFKSTRCGYSVAHDMKTTDKPGEETCLACKKGPPAVIMRAGGDLDQRQE